jgi:hypothetical protein
VILGFASEEGALSPFSPRAFAGADEVPEIGCSRLSAASAHAVKDRPFNLRREALGRGRERFDKQAEQRLKAAMQGFDPKTVNDLVQ